LDQLKVRPDDAMRKSYLLFLTFGCPDGFELTSEVVAVSHQRENRHEPAPE
jgi:hypothetical protein